MPETPRQHEHDNTPDRGGSSSLSRDIIARTRALGFALSGVSEARPSDYAEHLRAWLAAGKHGEMDYLADQLTQRLNPNSMLPGVRSIIAVGDLYTPRGGGASREPIPADHGRLARYSRGKDYHRVIKKRLHALCDALREEHPPHEFRACVDIEPTLEREHAERAGIGWVGKHTLLIHPEHGSYFLLGLILTTLPLEAPAEQPRFPDHCGGCTRCIDACPTDAIAPAHEARSVDASRCISYLTLETRGAVPEEFHAPLADMLAGCDICQEVCPHNSANRSSDAQPREEYTPRFTSLPLLEVLNWTPADRAARLTGMALKRATLQMWKRNALLALGNALKGDGLGEPDRRALLTRVRDLTTDEDAVVRYTAQSVLARSE